MSEVTPFFYQDEEAPRVKSDPEMLISQLEQIITENVAIFENIQEMQSRIEVLLNDAETMKVVASVDPNLKARLGRVVGAVLKVFPIIAQQRSEVKRLKEQEVQQERLFKKAEEIFDSQALEKIRAMLKLGDVAIQERVMSGLKTATNSKTEAEQKAAAQGMLFEISRLDVLRTQRREHILEGVQPTITTSYEGRDGKRVSQALVKPDAFLERSEGLFAYEVKALPRLAYGSVEAHYNQILKYQASIDQRQLIGTTVELRGRIDPTFLKWAVGSGLEDPGLVPDVEILYTLPLPSGAEYRFPLKQTHKAQGLSFVNNDEMYTIEDRRIVAGLQKALQDRSITSILSFTQVTSSELKPFEAHPMKIESGKQFEAFQRETTQNIHKQLLEKRVLINHDNRLSAIGAEFTTIEGTKMVVANALKTFQLFLQENPAVAKAKAAYVIDSAHWPTVVDLATKHIQDVRAYERDRAESSIEHIRREERQKLGYFGRPEGVALDLDHYLLDAIQEINSGLENIDVQKRKKGKAKEFELKRGRNYEHPERFRRVEDIATYLSTQDRLYREAQVLDPLKKNEVGTPKTEIVSSRIDQLEMDLLKGNLQRAEVIILLPTLRARMMTLKAIPERNAIEEQSYVELEKRLALLEALSKELNLLPWQDQLAQLSEAEKGARIELSKRLRGLPIAIPMIERLSNAVIALRIEKAAVVEAEKDVGLKRQQANEFDKRITGKMYELAQVYKSTIGGEKSWQKIARRTTRVIEKNLIKFIYIVKSDGTILTDEEKLRGVAVTGRAAHSEPAEGRNIYGGGELAFEKTANGTWQLHEINNGSGHYRPDSTSLFYVKNLLDQKGIDTSKALLRDSLLRGASTPDMSLSDIDPVDAESVFDSRA